VLGDHGIDDADQGFLIIAGEVLHDAEALQKPVVVKRSGFGGVAGQQVVDRDAEEFGEEHQLVGRRRMESHLVFVELGGMHAELGGDFLLGEFLLFPQAFDALSAGGADAPFTGRNGLGRRHGAGRH